MHVILYGYMYARRSCMNVCVCRDACMYFFLNSEHKGIRFIVYICVFHRHAQVVDGLVELARLLNQSRVPRRIEGVDISHIQGFGAVAAISVL